MFCFPNVLPCPYQEYVSHQGNRKTISNRIAISVTGPFTSSSCQVVKGRGCRGGSSFLVGVSPGPSVGRGGGSSITTRPGGWKEHTWSVNIQPRSPVSWLQSM